MATNLLSCFLIQFLEQLLKFLANFTLLKYVKSQRSYGFLITKELIFGFQILDLKVHFSASLMHICMSYCQGPLISINTIIIIGTSVCDKTHSLTNSTPVMAMAQWEIGSTGRLIAFSLNLNVQKTCVSLSFFCL